MSPGRINPSLPPQLVANLLFHYREEVKAYVVRRDASAVEVMELASYLSDRLARFKVPRYWEFRDVLPHTPSERIAKHELEQGRADFRESTVDLKA